MRMLLPGGTVPLQIQGSVEYSQDRRCGLNFLYSSAEERKQVQTFIQSMLVVGISRSDAGSECGASH